MAAGLWTASLHLAGRGSEAAPVQAGSAPPAQAADPAGRSAGVRSAASVAAYLSADPT